jgi:immune inhibitor A
VPSTGSVPQTALPTAIPSPTPSPPTSGAPPDRDLWTLALRLGRVAAPVSPVAQTQPPSYAEGDRQTFNVLDSLAPALKNIGATLRLATPHAYFYFEDEGSITAEELASAGREFEEKVYPEVASYFGQEWSPGVDDDPRITLLHADLAGVGGLFSDQDEYPRAVSPSSNEREMVYLGIGPGSFGYNGLVAHELQHLVHWNADPTEEAWVNEGLSELAAEIVGGGQGYTGTALANPDTELNVWEPLGGNNIPHYGMSHLFFRYLLDRYGGWEGAAKLLKEPDDGIADIDAYLEPFGTTFLDVFTDWVVANYLNDPAGGRYSQPNMEAHASPALMLDDYQDGTGDVHQFAADYIEVNLPQGDAVFSFDGAQTVDAIPNQEAHAGGQWWSNRGDAIDSTLTAEFDLTGLASATLRFRTWYDIEEGWDYAYVMASTDGGSTWNILPGRHTTEENPMDLAYGPAFTGKSGGGDRPSWVDEEVDLTPFAGEKILLRFEYITDEGVNLDGFAIDDISIPELGFFDDAETDGRWQAEGFLRLTGPLPQRFVVQVIEVGQTTSVTAVALDEANSGQVRLSGFGSTLDKAVIVVAAVTDGTRQPASYRYSLQPAGP